METHIVFSHTFSAVQYGHSVSHREHPVEIQVLPMSEPASLY
jgi:hypothetical protein